MGKSIDLPGGVMQADHRLKEPLPYLRVASRVCSPIIKAPAVSG